MVHILCEMNEYEHELYVSIYLPSPDICVLGEGYSIINNDHSSLLHPNSNTGGCWSLIVLYSTPPAGNKDLSDSIITAIELLQNCLRM